VGPGVRNLGEDDVWADRTDTRTTMLNLLGLQDSYIHDGRVLTDVLYNWAIPQSLRAQHETLQELGEVYKQLNAPFGQFAKDTLIASTQAIKSGSATDDSMYTQVEAAIEQLTTQRAGVAAQMRAMLDGAAFKGQAINEQQAKKLIQQAEKLLDRAEELIKN